MKTCAHECQQHLKNRKKMLLLCRLPAELEGASDSESDSSASEANEFGIRGPRQTADENNAAPEEEDLDEVLPLWAFDPEQAQPDDLEELSEVPPLNFAMYTCKPVLVYQPLLAASDDCPILTSICW